MAWVQKQDTGRNEAKTMSDLKDYYLLCCPCVVFVLTFFTFTLSVPGVLRSGTRKALCCLPLCYSITIYLSFLWKIQALFWDAVSGLSCYWTLWVLLSSYCDCGHAYLNTVCGHSRHCNLLSGILFLVNYLWIANRTRQSPQTKYPVLETRECPHC